MINCLIIDDEPLAQSILEGYIVAHTQLNLVKKCSTAFEAFEILHQQQIDLLFLDIKMPGLNGIDFLKSLKAPPTVIFTTAFSEYAAESYNLEAIDYLLKPITKERFDRSLERLFKQQPPIKEKQPDYTYFKASGKLIKVEHQDILFAKSVKDYIVLHTKNDYLIVHMTMKYLCNLLPEKTFKRIHRSYLVNFRLITIIGKNEVHIENKILPIGESYKQGISELRER